MATTQITWQSIKNIFIIVLILGIITFFAVECHRDIKNGELAKAPDNAYKYETSYVYKEEYFKLRDSLKNLKPIPPITVDNWLTPDPIVIDSMAIFKGYLKLYPQNKPEVSVLTDFVVNYPKAPKLINMDLIKDSISLSFYNTEAKLYTETYPLYLDSYGYTYKDGTMNIYDNPSKVLEKRPKLKWDNLYVNGGYDIYNKAAITGLEYNLSPGRFKLDINAEVLILEQPKLNLNAKVGYRLFK